jgi:hypothetical protein
LDHEAQILLAGENSITNGWAERGFGDEPGAGPVNLLHVRGTGETERSGEILAIGAFSTTATIGFTSLSPVEHAPSKGESVGNVSLQKWKTDQYVQPVIPTHPLNVKRILRLFHKPKGKRGIWG